MLSEQCFSLLFQMATKDAGLNWTAIGVGISLFLGIATLVITSWRNWKDNRYKRSQFYFEEIKKMLSNAIEILVSAGNNNIKWHQAIELCKAVEKLFCELTDKSHKYMYIITYTNLGYAIVDYIEQLTDYRFYYGLGNYKEESGESLFDKGVPRDFQSPCTRISPDSLLYLCKFIDKLAQANYDIYNNNSPCQKILKSNYFKKSIDENYQISEFTKPVVRFILEYIADYKKNSLKRNKVE